MDSAVALFVTGAIVSLLSSVVTVLLSYCVQTMREKREYRRRLLERLGKQAAQRNELKGETYAELANKVRSIIDDDVLSVWHGALEEWTKDK